MVINNYKERDGRPLAIGSTTLPLGEDGRPQGAPPRISTAPVPTMYGRCGIVT